MLRHFNYTNKYSSISWPLLLLLGCCVPNENPSPKNHLQLVSARIGTVDLDIENPDANNDLPLDQPIVVSFSVPLNTSSVLDGVRLMKDNGPVAAAISFLDEDATFSLRPQNQLDFKQTYVLEVAQDLRGKQDETFGGASIQFTTTAPALELVTTELGGNMLANKMVNVPRNLAAKFTFSAPLDPQTATPANFSLSGRDAGSPQVELSNENKTVTISSAAPLDHFNRYVINLGTSIRGIGGEKFGGSTQVFYTELDQTPKFPLVSDEDLLTLVQQQTFKYFWDFAHPASGMARERNTSGNTVTSGGSGFGIMAIIVGIERNFITRSEGVQRLDMILTFLEGANRYHGAWPHWMNGNTGAIIPFSANDNGGDLVETAFLIQGLLTVRQYLDPADATEQGLIARINSLWQSVEWSWYRQAGQNVLYWHWSPDKDWVMNLPIRGWNEGLIIYVLAAASPTYPITSTVYTNGWARDGAIKNGNAYYDIILPLGSSFGGPLFFSHYSFLGLDPRNLTDAYANYWVQNINHSLINQKHAIVNPNNFVGYSGTNWGFTASDNQSGYSAHSPTNDLGVIAPTAALSSFPYTPSQSMDALKFFYYTLGDKLWGEHGFYDAFNTTAGWYGTSYLAIDQGPIIVMIENHRTGLLWNLFMSCPEVQTGLTNLGFTF